MALIRTVKSFVARRVHALLAPLHQRLHDRAHRRRAGEIAPRRREEWWGSDARWYLAGTPPRRHNRITPLIDGEQYFTALAEALAGAQAYLYVVGWCLTPHNSLHRADSEALMRTQILSLLETRGGDVCVRILLWSGSFAFLQPTRATMKGVQQSIQSRAKGDLQCRLDHTAHFSHCHHQKAVVVDGRVAFVGGMDLTTYQGDRWDVQSHPLRAGPSWHDVQLQIEGEAVADVEENFRQRWIAATGSRALPHRAPTTDPAWATPVQIVRTIPRGVYGFAPQGEFGVRHCYLEALRRAERFIYLENQYLWSPEVRDVLIEAIERKRTQPFRIVVVLPARAYSGKWDNDRHVGRLRDADQGRGVLSVYALYASGPSAGRHPLRYRAIYVHAKVGIVDDEWLTVGSANLNGRGLLTDTEMNAVASDAVVTRRIRVDLWSEHLGMPREQVEAADPIELIDRIWPSRAAETAKIIKEGARPLVSSLHRYERGHMPSSWLLEETEALTLEH